MAENETPAHLKGAAITTPQSEVASLCHKMDQEKQTIRKEDVGSLTDVLPELTSGCCQAPPTHEERVRTMMQGFKQATPPAIGIPDQATRILRVRLLLEEVLEFAEASGVGVTHPAPRRDGTLLFEDLAFEPRGEPDLPLMADGLADISVVNTGAFIACGIPMEPILRCVDENNLLKIRNGRTDEFGKFQKPKDHPAPDVAGCLRALGWVSTDE